MRTALTDQQRADDCTGRVSLQGDPFFQDAWHPDVGKCRDCGEATSVFVLQQHSTDVVSQLLKTEDGCCDYFLSRASSAHKAPGSCAI